MKIRVGQRVGISAAVDGVERFGLIAGIKERDNFDPLVTVWVAGNRSQWAGWRHLDASHIIPFTSAARALRARVEEQIRAARKLEAP